MNLSAHQKQYRPIYLSRPTTYDLDLRAKLEGIPTPMLINRYVREGLERPSGGKKPDVDPPRALYVTGGFYLDGNLIMPLENRALDLGCTTAELLRRFMEEGLTLPPKAQAVTRLQEISTLKASLAAYRREAEAAARPCLDEAEKLKQGIAAELTALRACCPHAKIVELKGAVSVYGCPCSDIEHLRHATKAGLCIDCGLFEGICLDAEARYRLLAPSEVQEVSYKEFVRLRGEFRPFIADR